MTSMHFIFQVSEAPSGKLTGLVIKKLTHRSSTVRKYKGVERDLRVLEDSQSLVLPNVTLQDAGRYRCFLSAPLGHQNQEGETHLKVYGECNDMKTHTFNMVSRHNLNLDILNVWE